MSVNELPPRPTKYALENLKGTSEFFEGVLSYKNPESLVPINVRLVVEGSGMIGLSDVAENREWAGMFNHYIKMTRLSLYVASLVNGVRELQGSEERVSLDRIMQAGLDSHTMRRTWDEAGWYPGQNHIVVEGKRKAQSKITNEKLGVIYLRERKTPEDIVTLVEALAHGLSVYPDARNTWEYRICVYVDHRTAQVIEPLKKRMGDFFIGGYAQNLLADDKAELRARIEHIIDTAKEMDMSPEDAAEYVKSDKSVEKFNRGIPLVTFMQLVIDDAQTERALEEMGLNPESWTDETIPVPRWERYLRRLYLQDAEDGIFTAIRDAKGSKRWDYLDRHKEGPTKDPFWTTFNQSSWWGKEVVAMYRQRKGKPHHSRHGRPEGIDRAIDLFAGIHSERRWKEEISQ